MKSLFLSFLCFFILFSARAQDNQDHYHEPFSQSYETRKVQHLEMRSYVDRLLRSKIDSSIERFRPDFSNKRSYEASLYPYRQELSEYFGYPPPGIIKERITKTVFVGQDKYCKIYRIWVEVAEGLHTYGILLIPLDIKRKAPLIIAEHGGSGNPEAIIGMDERKPYHNFGYEAVKRGYIVWAPALTMFSSYAGDKGIAGATRDIFDTQLKLIGTSIIGVEIHKIIASTKAIIKEYPEIDADNIGMAGLSWGGSFTMYTTALWPLIKAAAISGNVTNTRIEFEKTLDPELLTKLSSSFTPFNFGYFQIIGMICPRPCFVQLGENDPLHAIKDVYEEMNRAELLYKNLEIPDMFEFKPHSGMHEFETESIFDFFKVYLK